MEFIISFFFAIAEHNILSLLIGYLLSGVIFFLAAKVKSDLWKFFLRFFALIIFIYSNINIFAGHSLTGYFIYNLGEKGNAVTVSIRQTNNQYNDYWIMEHSIILETSDGLKYETTFEDADFNIYPKPDAGYVYPAIGERYSVKYLKSNPKAFVIISNDNSQYANRLRCDNLMNIYSEAFQKYKFDSLNPVYRDAFRKAKDDFFNFGCPEIFIK